MLKSKSYRIDVLPISWKRVGVATGNHFFDRQKRDKIAFGLYLAQQHENQPLFCKAIAMDITFFMKKPKIPKLKYAQYHSTTPDLDNLCKFLLDAIKGVVINDDRIICSLSAKKVYDIQPRTEFTVTEVE